jgi:hypothetical protein
LPRPTTFLIAGPAPAAILEGANLQARCGGRVIVKEELAMALAVHSSSEIGKIMLWVAAFAVFVVVALTWVPDLIAPQGEQGAPEVGRTTRMIQ